MASGNSNTASDLLEGLMAQATEAAQVSNITLDLVMGSGPQCVQWERDCQPEVLLQSGVAHGNRARAMKLAGSLSKTKELALETTVAHKSMAASQAQKHWLAQLGSPGMRRCTGTPGQQQQPRTARSGGSL